MEAIDKDQINLLKGAIIVSIVMLFLGIPTGWPYGYYTLLRWVVTASAIFAVYITYNLKKNVWVIPLIIVALVFNPLVPVYLAKETWVLIDFVSAIFFLLFVFQVKNTEIK